ncbi:hypothetical protein BC834DRAFT_897475 [Gloeopeniophorella convolvens]|nr:hypothetical protein BC834DRAFT_897475 [Gloeopeniophorella convolvens]
MMSACTDEHCKTTGANIPSRPRACISPLTPMPARAARGIGFSQRDVPPHLAARGAPSGAPLRAPAARAMPITLLRTPRAARAITWPTVPRDAARMRACMCAGYTREEPERLVRAVVEWAKGAVREECAWSGERTMVKQRAPVERRGGRRWWRGAVRAGEAVAHVCRGVLL